jgi:hypothetical protein
VSPIRMTANKAQAHRLQRDDDEREERRREDQTM